MPRLSSREWDLSPAVPRLTSSQPCRQIYAVCFAALAIGILTSEPAQLFFGQLVENKPDIRLVFGVPISAIAVVVALTVLVELLGGKIFDFDINTAYRNVFRQLDEMVAEMEELRA